MYKACLEDCVIVYQNLWIDRLHEYLSLTNHCQAARTRLLVNIKETGHFFEALREISRAILPFEKLLTKRRHVDSFLAPPFEVNVAAYLVVSWLVCSKKVTQEAYY